MASRTIDRIFGNARKSEPVPSIYSSARTELAKLLIYGLFRKIRVLAQDGVTFPIGSKSRCVLYQCTPSCAKTRPF